MKKHILVVDDEPDIRDMLRDALVISGYRVTAVGSAAEALQVVRDDPPQLVITDLQLPEADGFEIIEQVKVVNPEIPIILLTGVLFDHAALKEAMGAKIACYIEKTVPLAQILSEVKKHLPK
jgi:DNA-binding NtrC family response regulator